jgi:hypothetical protein
MPEIHVYEPALCCTSGVCRPELDQALVAFTADVAHVNGFGGHVARHNLASAPAPLRSLSLVSVTEACCAPSSSDGSTGGCC